MGLHAFPAVHTYEGIMAYYQYCESASNAESFVTADDNVARTDSNNFWGSHPNDVEVVHIASSTWYHIMLVLGIR